MKRGFTLLEVMLALAIFALAATAVLQIASGALSNQQVLEEKTVAGWVAENQTALLYLMSREQRAVRHQGESDRMTLHSPQWGEIERIWLLRGPQLS